MPQIKISLDDASIDFVNKHQKYGYTSKSAIIADAVSRLRQEIRQDALIQSAELYQEVYEQDTELQELTDDAASLCLD